MIDYTNLLKTAGNKDLLGPNADYKEIEKRIHNGEHDLIGKLIRDADNKMSKHGGGYLTLGNKKEPRLEYVDKLHNKVFNEGKASLHKNYIREVKQAIAYHQLANDLAFNNGNNIKQIYGDFDLSKNYKHHPLEDIVDYHTSRGKNMHGMAYRAITEHPDYLAKIEEMKKSGSKDFSWFKPLYVDENNLPTAGKEGEAELNLMKHNIKQTNKNNNNTKDAEMKKILSNEEQSKIDQHLYKNHKNIYDNFHDELDSEVEKAAGTTNPNELGKFIETPKGIEIYNKHYGKLINEHGDKLKSVLGDEHPVFNQEFPTGDSSKSAFERLMAHKGKIAAGVGLTGAGAFLYNKYRNKDKNIDKSRYK